MGETAPTLTRLAPSIRVRLSAMMFLQNFVIGGWFVTLGTYLAQELHASGSQIALAALSQSLGALVAPFVVGAIADRLVSAQKIMGVLHIVAGLLLLVASRVDSFGPFFGLVLLTMLCFTPTPALGNAVALGQLPEPGRQFSSIRVFGTVGWIVAGLLIGWLGWEHDHRLVLTLLMAGCADVLLGIFCFFLPATPPQPAASTGVRRVIGPDALALLRKPAFLIFFCASIAVCIPLAFYYNFTNLYLNEIGVRSAAAVQTLGQVSEVAILLVLGVVIDKLGFKKTLVLGMAAWALRYLCFAFGGTGAGFALIIIGLTLHGLCFGFFFVAGQVYADRIAGDGRRSSAQGLIALATNGVGLLIGSLISGPIVDAFAITGGHAWTTVWLIPAGITLLVLIGIVVLFREEPAVRRVTGSSR